MMRTAKQQKPGPGRRTHSSTAAAKAQGDQTTGGTLSLHKLFEQQTRRMLDRTDLEEEQKQTLLLAMSCPCCGAGAMSYTVKLRRR